MKKLYMPLLILLSFVFSFTSCAEIPSDTEDETTIPISTEHIHTEEIIPSVPATCTEAGLSEGVLCAVCHEVLIAQETVPAHGHHYEDSICTVCGHKTTKGLTFSLNNSGDSYTVSGVGTAVDTEICIPDTYNGLPVTNIGVSAFGHCTNLTSIVLPSGVTSIGYGAFFGCVGLTSIEIPGDVTSIGEYVFNRCAKLTSITFRGTRAQWNAITKGHGWNFSTGNYIIHCVDREIGK